MDDFFYFDQQDAEEPLKPMAAGGSGGPGAPPSRTAAQAEGCNAAYVGSEFCLVLNDWQSRDGCLNALLGAAASDTLPDETRKPFTRPGGSSVLSRKYLQRTGASDGETAMLRQLRWVRATPHLRLR